MVTSHAHGPGNCTAGSQLAGDRVCTCTCKHVHAEACIHGHVLAQVGESKLRDGVSLNYAGIEGFRIAGNQGLGIICACQVPPPPSLCLPLPPLAFLTRSVPSARCVSLTDNGWEEPRSCCGIPQCVGILRCEVISIHLAPAFTVLCSDYTRSGNYRACASHCWIVYAQLRGHEWPGVPSAPRTVRAALVHWQSAASTQHRQLPGGIRRGGAMALRLTVVPWRRWC